MSCDSNIVEKKTKRKRRNRNSSKQHDKQVNKDVLRANKALVHFSDTLSSVRRPKHSGVMWKKKGSSNTIKADLSSVNHLSSNKNVKRYSRKDLMSCNNSHLKDSRRCSKHMTGNRALLTNFVEKFLRTARFGNNDFTVIAGYENPLYLLQMDLCGLMRVESINGKGYVLVVVDDFSRYTWVFFLHSKDEASEVIISFIKKTQVNLQLQVQHVQTDNVTEFKNKILAKFFNEVGISQQFSAARTPQKNGVVERRNQTLVEAARTMLTFANLPMFLWAKAISIACFTQNRSIIQKRVDKTPYELINKRKPNIKIFHVFGCRCYLLNDYDDVGKLKATWDIGVFVGYSKDSAAFKEKFFMRFLNHFKGESFSSSLNDDVHQSPEEGIIHQTNTQSISNDMIPNVDEASLSHNVFNERLEDAYFDISTVFHDTSNVHEFYQPYPHETKWTKDHPLHKIIGDPKSSVRTRGQLANSCLFTCLLSSIEPSNVAEPLKDADWVIAM
nr:retrovirus-related Pol polyprotein from transposon TNT 1-94 [Tanacetum cinerariifolium]